MAEVTKMNEIKISKIPVPTYAVDEAMNRLATSLSFCGKDMKVIELTSRFAGEGKSYVSLNLMRTIANLGKRVVLIDADLRRSSLVQRYKMKFKQENSLGLAQYLAGMCSMEDIVYMTNIPNAYYVPVGKLVNSSLRLLSGPLFQQLVEGLREKYDVILIDTPPVDSIVDAVEISKSCDGVLLVVKYGTGTKKEIGGAVESVTLTGCPVVGIVMNMVDMHKFTNRKYYYSKGYYGYYKNDDLYTKDKKAEQ